MDVSLDRDLERFVRDKVRSGQFGSLVDVRSDPKFQG